MNNCLKTLSGPGSDFRKSEGLYEKRGAFTLVELLVVVAIIALLVSILLPPLGKAKEQAKIVICLLNLKGLGLGFAQYAAENNDWYPPGSGWGGDPPIWDFSMVKYYENKGLLHCPADNLERTYGSNPQEHYPRSYAINIDVTWMGPSVYGKNYDPPYNGRANFPWPGWVHKTTDVTDPSDTILLGEQWESWYYYSTYVAGRYNKYRGSGICWENYDWDRRGPTDYVHRNNDAANYLFCGGHARLIPKDDPNLQENDFYYWHRER